MVLDSQIRIFCLNHKHKLKEIVFEYSKNLKLSKNISRNGVYFICNLSSRENPRFELFVISRNATLDVNRSLNSA